MDMQQQQQQQQGTMPLNLEQVGVGQDETPMSGY